MHETTEPMTILRLRRQVSELARGYRAAQVLLACVKLGVCEAIAAGAATEAEIAAATGCDPRGVGLLLNAAASLGLLVKRDGRFANSELAAVCLTRSGAGYMAGSLRLEQAFYRRWGRLAEAVRTGQRPEEDRSDEAAGDWVRNFVYGLRDMARPQAPVIAEALALPDDRPLRVIDVGGCHAAYSLALARRHPRLTAVVFELPAVVPFAREIIAQEGLADRVMVQEGDFQREGLGAGYDVALVFGVLNGEPPAGRPALIRKVYDCLNPGGRIVLRDFVLDDDRVGPPEAALFALQMLLATEAGGLDTRGDWAAWLAEAGFGPPQVIALPEAIGGSLTVAEKR
ncbi:MAG: methyltransferase [Anaerolineae bacterium]